MPRLTSGMCVLACPLYFMALLHCTSSGALKALSEPLPPFSQNYARMWEPRGSLQKAQAHFNQRSEKVPLLEVIRVIYALIISIKHAAGLVLIPRVTAALESVWEDQSVLLLLFYSSLNLSSSLMQFYNLVIK